MNITLYFPDQSELAMDFPIVPRIGEQIAFRRSNNDENLEWYQVTNVAYYTSKILKTVPIIAVLLKRIL